MWTSRAELLTGGVRYEVTYNAQAATFGDVLQAWQHDEAFWSWFNELLAASPFTAFRWETPGINQAAMGRPFEFVLLDDPRLARQPDANAFAKHFPKAAEGIAAFSNLSGDAVLVVPAPLTESDAYGHLAAFVRKAPETQCQALWHAVATAMVERLRHQPVWLSTAGAGVSWLHVRLDDSPKYYGYRPYRQTPAA